MGAIIVETTCRRVPRSIIPVQAFLPSDVLAAPHQVVLSDAPASVLLYSSRAGTGHAVRADDAYCPDERVEAIVDRTSGIVSVSRRADTTGRVETYLIITSNEQGRALLAVLGE